MVYSLREWGTMSMQFPTLLEYFDQHYVIFRSLTAGSIANLRRSLGEFVAWLKIDPPIDGLRDDQVSRWIMHMEQSGLSPKTIKNRRGDLLGVWRDACAWDESGTVRMPRRIRDVQVPDPEPDSWSDAEVANLVLAARSLRGRFSFGPTRALYLEALIRTAWESGLRWGDLRSLRLEHIGAGGVIQKTQSKTGVLHCGKLATSTLRLLEQIDRNPPLDWPLDRSGLWYWLHRLKSLSGVLGEGQLHRIRASASTHVAIHQPGMETVFLGHTTTKADKHYIDRKRLPSVAVSPGPLPLPRKGA